jgi:hypothetical protein
MCTGTTIGLQCGVEAGYEALVTQFCQLTKRFEQLQVEVRFVI